MKMQRILVVEDEKEIAEAIKKYNEMTDRTE